MALSAQKVLGVARTYKPKTTLNKLEFSPNVNPLIQPQEIQLKRRYVRTAGGRDLVDPKTGLLSAVASVHVIEEKDDAEFVKVFADGVKAAFGLTRTGARVFQAVLEIYQSTTMKGGYVEAVELFWFDKGLSGRDVGMSEDTFKRGLRELLDKGFLSPRMASSFWVNPALFFKGDRVAFVKEYRRRAPPPPPQAQALIDRDPNTADMFDEGTNDHD